MFILIQDRNELLRVEITKNILPFNYRGIEIVDKSGRLYICLHKGFFFSDRDKVRRLEERKYVIKTSDLISEINLFVYSDSKGIDDYKLYNNEPFLYISSPKANIENKDLLLKEYYLMYKDHKLKTNAPVLLLNGKAYKDEELCSGDFVSFYNFSFYYYDDFLYINNFLVENRIKEKELDELSIIYENVKPLTHNYLLNEPKIIEIPEIKKYNEVRKIKQKPLVYQIGPSLTMSLAMIFVASINVYKNYLDGNDLTNSLVYMIMPFMMVISGIGSGFAIRYGGAMDGIEVMAVIFAKRIGITVGTFVMIYNIILYIICGIVLKSWILPLYSIVTYTAALKTIDFIVEGIDRAKCAIIITEKPDKICKELGEAFGSGVTRLNAKGAYSHREKAMIYFRSCKRRCYTYIDWKHVSNQPCKP